MKAFTLRTAALPRAECPEIRRGTLEAQPSHGTIAGATLNADYLYLMQALLARISSLREAGRAVILLGDLNISLATIDSCDPGSVEDFNSRQDRRMLTTLLTHNGGPFLDTFRKFHPDRCDT